MSHDDAFAAFREKREQARATTFKVTWRKVSPLTGGGYSGLGPGGQLVFVGPRNPSASRSRYAYGSVVEGRREVQGHADNLAQAKRLAAALLSPLDYRDS